MITKGTWKIREISGLAKASFLGGTDEYQIMSDNGVECLAVMGTGWASGNAEANAKLIAAAPDMLEALKATINAEDSIPDYMAQIINVAIAKAEGE